MERRGLNSLAGYVVFKQPHEAMCTKQLLNSKTVRKRCASRVCTEVGCKNYHAASASQSVEGDAL